jgi:hypothetical protein
MRMSQALAEYRQMRERVRWMTCTRLRYMERRGRRQARAGELRAGDAVRLTAVRDELAARGAQLQPMHGGRA